MWSDIRPSVLEDAPGTTGSYMQDVKPNGGVKEKQGKMVVITKETGLHAGEPFGDAIWPPWHHITRSSILSQ